MTTPKTATARWCESCEEPMSPNGLFPVSQVSAMELNEHPRFGAKYIRVRKVSKDSSLCTSCYVIFNEESDDQS